MRLTIKLYILVLFFVGLFLLLIGHFTEPQSIEEFLTAIGQTLIGSSVVSFFLTLEDVQNLFLGLVKEILVDPSNAKIFSRQQLEKMHSICHQRLHFQNMKVDKKDWDDLSNKCITTITSPYYSNWRETIECKIIKDIIEKNINLDFELINPITDGEISVNISRSYFLNIPDGMIKENFVKVTSLIIEKDGKNLNCTPFVEFSYYDNKVYNTYACIKCREYDLENITFKKQVKVKMVYTTRVSKDDKSYTNRLKYSARHYLMNFICNDSRVSIYPNFFGGFIQLGDFDRHNGNGNIFIECKDKLILPGSGASIVLNFNDKINKNGTRRELLKTK